MVILWSFLLVYIIDSEDIQDSRDLLAPLRISKILVIVKQMLLVPRIILHSLIML